jgi:hypothetical protein
MACRGEVWAYRGERAYNPAAVMFDDCTRVRAAVIANVIIITRTIGGKVKRRLNIAEISGFVVVMQRNEHFGYSGGCIRDGQRLHALDFHLLNVGLKVGLITVVELRLGLDGSDADGTGGLGIDGNDDLIFLLLFCGGGVHASGELEISLVYNYPLSSL